MKRGGEGSKEGIYPPDYKFSWHNEKVCTCWEQESGMQGRGKWHRNVLGNEGKWPKVTVVLQTVPWINRPLINNGELGIAISLGQDSISHWIINGFPEWIFINSNI